jgi:hypothetical protein
MGKSSKQKLNTKSSTEAELFGARGYLPYRMRAKYFLEAQGYMLKEKRFYQDNLSTSGSRKMDVSPVDQTPGTLTLGIFLSNIESVSQTSICNTANQTNVGGFLYKAVARKYLPKIQRRDHGT